ncbi:MAG: FAD-dependent oxidoreductase [Bacteroidota bacterium]
MFNRSAYLVPSVKENVFNVGATYQHPPFTEGITEESRQDLKSKLEALLAVPFEILHQDWGIRPTTPDRRPLIGAHPKNKNVIIFNGLGTKGVSLAPYFAHHVSDWLEGKSDLSAEVNIFRFKALYSG